jgi:hypothetical protein
MVLAKTINIPSGGLLELTVHRSVRRTQVQKHESLGIESIRFKKVVWDEISNGFLFRITLIAQLHRRSPSLLHYLHNREISIIQLT